MFESFLSLVKWLVIMGRHCCGSNWAWQNSVLICLRYGIFTFIYGFRLLQPSWLISKWGIGNKISHDAFWCMSPISPKLALDWLGFYFIFRTASCLVCIYWKLNEPDLIYLFSVYCDPKAPRAISQEIC